MAFFRELNLRLFLDELDWIQMQYADSNWKENSIILSFDGGLMLIWAKNVNNFLGFKK